MGREFETHAGKISERFLVRFLVVHDRETVAEAIKALLVETAGVRCVVDLVKDMVGARDLLRANHYDLAVVDLTLPVTERSSDSRFDIANMLLEEMFAGENLKTPADVIAISVDGDAVVGIRNTIGEHVLAVIGEDPDGRWRELLRDKVRYVLNTRRSRLAAANSTYFFDVVLVTALDKEAAPYGSLLGLTDCPELRDAREFVFQTREGRMGRGAVLKAGKSGQAPAASMTQAALTQLRPRLIMMTGFCGGVRSRVKLGDVVAFRSAAAWDYGKWVQRKVAEGRQQTAFQARPDALNVPVRGVGEIVRDLVALPYQFDDAVRGQVAKVSDGKCTAPRLKEAAAGSGSAVVTSKETLDRIIDLNENIHAIDMESYGFYYACLHTPVVTPDFICIKGVADYCNGGKNSKYHDACSLLSAHLAIDIIQNHYDFCEAP